MQVYLVYFIYFWKNASGSRTILASLSGNRGQPRGRPPYIGGRAGGGYR